MSPWFSGMDASHAITLPSCLAGSHTTTDNGEGLFQLFDMSLDVFHGQGKRPVLIPGMICSFDGAALTGVKMGNAFGDNDAFLAVDADCPWVKVTVAVAGSLKAFNGALQHATVIQPVVGAVGEGGGM